MQRSSLRPNLPKIEFSWWCGTLSCTITCTEIVFDIPTFHFQITTTMETIVLTKSQLCNIISLSTMCATTKFNGTVGASASRKHRRKPFKRNIQIGFHTFVDCKRTHTAHGMSDHRLHLFRGQHFRFCSKLCFIFCVI